MTPSLRRRAGVPRRRLPTRGCDGHRRGPGASRSSGAPVYGREADRPDHPSWSGRSGRRVDYSLASQASATGSSASAGEVHVRDRLEDLRDRPVGEVVVDIGGDRRVLGGLGLVDVDVQVAGDRVAAVGDGLGGRARRTSPFGSLETATSLTLSLFSSAKANPTQPSELPASLATALDDGVVVRARGVVRPRGGGPCRRSGARSAGDRPARRSESNVPDSSPGPVMSRAAPAGYVTFEPSSVASG